MVKINFARQKSLEVVASIRVTSPHMDPLKNAPDRGWPRVGHFLRRARAPRSARQAATDTGVSIRTIQSYELAEIDYAKVQPLMAVYAGKIAGWTEADILAIYEGGDPPAVSPQPRPGLGGPGEPISEDTLARALAAIWGLPDVPMRERKRLAAIIENLPLESQYSQEATQVTPSNGNEVDTA